MREVDTKTEVSSPPSFGRQRRLETWLLRRYVSPVTVGPEGPMADEASAAGQGTRPTNVFGQGDLQERSQEPELNLRQQFRRGESGQNLTEWALLVALVAIGSAALVNQSGSSISGVWTATNLTLQGQSQAQGQSSAPVAQPGNEPVTPAQTGGNSVTSGNGGNNGNSNHRHGGGSGGGGGNGDHQHGGGGSDHHHGGGGQ